jgi:hypothetical protein
LQNAGSPFEIKEKVMNQQRLDNFRSITPQEIEEWCEGKSLEEIREAMTRDNTHLREALDIGVDDLPQGRGENAVEDVIVSKIEHVEAEAQRQREEEEAEEAEREAERERHAAAARVEQGREVQRRFLERHPKFIPSEELGNQLRDAYLAIDPSATEWDDVTLEAAYSNLLVEKLEGR